MPFPGMEVQDGTYKAADDTKIGFSLIINKDEVVHSAPLLVMSTSPPPCWKVDPTLPCAE